MDGNFFKRRRNELKLTQRDIALALNMTTAAISAWENGLALPQLDIVDRVAAAYKVSPGRLMNEMKLIAEQRAAVASK